MKNKALKFDDDELGLGTAAPPVFAAAAAGRGAGRGDIAGPNDVYRRPAPPNPRSGRPSVP